MEYIWKPFPFDIIKVIYLFSAMCLQFFPPSAGFQPYLLGYIQRHFEAGGGVGGMGGNGMNHDSLEGMRWSIHAQISHYACK